MALTRGTWAIERKIAGVWTDEGQTIYRPNMNLPIKQTSTQQKTKLADGSWGFFNPETKYNSEALTLKWSYLPKTYKDQIDTYVQNLYDLRITDHNGTIYYGRFVNVTAAWLVGQEDKYDVSADFDLIPGIA